MARARNIKPGFFSNDQLLELPFSTRLLFIGLWVIADRAGRLLDRPKKIKIDVFPGDDVDCDAALNELAAAGFIRRYEAGGIKAICITTWDKHQNPHCKECASTIPAPDERRAEPGASPVQNSCDASPIPEAAHFLPERARLIPDSLNLIPDPGSPIPDSPSLIPSLSSPPASQLPTEKKSAAPKEDTELQAACKETWRRYATAFLGRYGTEPTRNAKVNTAIKGFVQRVSYDEAPQIAEFYLSHNDAFYVRKCHDAALLQSDAEKLRTEWATNRRVTGTQARQAEQTSSNFENSRVALEMLRAEGYQ